MTVKEYLEQYKTLDARINAKIEQVEHLRAMFTRAYSGGNTGGGNSGPYDKIGEITAKIVDLESEINDEIDKLIDLRAEIKGYIAQIPNEKNRFLLELHYINGYSFDKIASLENRDRRSILYRHEKGLKFLEKVVKIP